MAVPYPSRPRKEAVLWLTSHGAVGGTNGHDNDDYNHSTASLRARLG